MAGKPKDRTGKRYGRLVAKRLMFVKVDAHWEFQCDCGNLTTVSIKAARTGNTSSCGCLRKEMVAAKNFKHGQTKRGQRTRLYRIWALMKNRCNPLSNVESSQKYYIKKGIKICHEWKANFVNFKNWSEQNGYQDDLEIERIDNNGNYEPENCKWATHLEQMHNTRRNVHLTHKGITKCLTEWAKTIGISHHALRYRINKGWPEEKLFARKKYVEIGN